MKLSLLNQAQKISDLLLRLKDRKEAINTPGRLQVTIDGRVQDEAVIVAVLPVLNQQIESEMGVLRTELRLLGVDVDA